MRTEKSMTLVRVSYFVGRDFTYPAANQQPMSKAWMKNEAYGLDAREMAVSQNGPAAF